MFQAKARVTMQNYSSRLRATIILVLVVVSVLSSFWAVLRTGDWEGLALNFGTEIAGAVITYALLELFVGGIQQRDTKRTDLIAQLGSGVADVALAAAEELRRYGWLYDGSLRGARLPRANLSGAHLGNVDLRGADLTGSNLQNADLHSANLILADLRAVNLVDANLSFADLYKANLIGAQLANANLSDADLRWAIYDRDTVWPSGFDPKEAGATREPLAL